jgi:hypothetical protein
MLQNYQYIDPYTILAVVAFYPKANGKIHFIKKKEAKFVNTFFFVTEADVWKMNSDQVRDFYSLADKKDGIVPSSKEERAKILYFKSNYLSICKYFDIELRAKKDYKKSKKIKHYSITPSNFDGYTSFNSSI